MKNETKKIAIACFIGGFICSAVAVAVNPNFWWLGMLAGFAGGYVAYEFREVLTATPIAWQSAKRGGNAVGREIKNWLKEWVFKKHPVQHPLVIVFCFFGYTTLPFIVGRLVLNCSRVLELVFLVIATVILLFLATWGLMFLLFTIFIKIGAEKEGWGINMEKELCYAGFGSTKQIEYSDLCRWWVKGLVLATKNTILFLAWKMWYWAIVGIWKTLCFFCRFLKKFYPHPFQ